jgi:hypothetical protein
MAKNISVRPRNPARDLTLAIRRLRSDKLASLTDPLLSSGLVGGFPVVALELVQRHRRQ